MLPKFLFKAGVISTKCVYMRVVVTFPYGGCPLYVQCSVAMQAGIKAGAPVILGVFGAACKLKNRSCSESVSLER